MGWDAVVVGAGHNGLVAANLLADAGWSVLVLEANATPGGATRTAELAAPGFRSELCSAFYPLTAASPTIAALDLGRYGLRWRHDHVPLVHVLPDGRTVTLSRDPAETAASVERYGAGDGERWLAEFAAWGRIKDALIGSLLSPFPPVRSGVRLARRLGPAELLRFARFAVQSTRRYSRELFRGEGARLLVTGNAMHADLTLDTSGSAIVGWLLSMLAQDVGYPVAEGGAQSITDALVRRLEQGGGEIRCGARVTAVEIRDGAAIGVRTADGEAHPATRAVLADVSAPALYRDLVGLPQLPARVASDLANFAWDDATVKVDWALSAPVPWTDPAVRRAGTVHLDLDLDGFGRFALDLASGRIPERPFILAGQMTTADPARSPAGTETLWAYTHVPRGLTWTAERAAEVADRVQATIERHAPGFGSPQRKAITADEEFERIPQRSRANKGDFLAIGQTHLQNPPGHDVFPRHADDSGRLPFRERCQRSRHVMPRSCRQGRTPRARNGSRVAFRRVAAGGADRNAACGPVRRFGFPAPAAG